MHLPAIPVVKLLTGNSVFEQLSDEAFLADWDDLFHTCSWATPYQHRAFVGAWYDLYRDSYEPILLIAQENGKLTGLLALALPTRKMKGEKRFILGAGHHDSDYQTWLCQEADRGAFIQAATLAVWKQFPAHHIMLKYVPTKTPLSWLSAAPFWKQRFALQPFTRPLMDTKAIEFSKHTKKRLNRLKKMATFERIVDGDVFRKLLDDQIGYLFDFRQGAMFNKHPFRNDPNNKKLLISLFDQGFLHVTVLREQTKIIAAVAVFTAKGQAYLGPINCHSPLYADQSPGYSHFIMLGQLLESEGIDSFDFTPGYDPYKERLANRHEQVHQLVITPSRLYFFKRQLRRWTHHRMVQAGIRPLNVQLEMRKRRYLLQHQGVTTTLKGWLKRSPKVVQPLYRIETPLISATGLVPLQKNHIGDLLQFESQGTALTRWEFLAMSMHRFERGEHCYTWVEDTRLMACVWVQEAKAAAPTAKDYQPATVPRCLQGIYCHPMARDRFTFFLKDVVAALATSTGVREVYAAVTDTPMRRSVEAIGFTNHPEQVPVESFSFLRPITSLLGMVKFKEAPTHATEKMSQVTILVQETKVSTHPSTREQ